MSWPLAPMGSCTKKAKTWNPSKDFPNGTIDYIDLSSVDKDTKSIVISDVPTITSVNAPSRARQLVKKSDTLVSTVRPNLNGVALVPSLLEGATASTGYSVLRADTDKLDPKYLFYWVQTPRFISDMMKKASGANYPAVSDKIIRESTIPLPPLPEQKRIVAILDKADAIRRKRQQAIELADEFLRSVFLDMFGDPKRNPKSWPACKLEDLTDGITYGLTVRPQYHETGIPLISAREIKSGEVNFTSCPRINIEDFNKLSDKAKPLSKDILFSKTGSIGHCALVQTNEPFAVTQNAARISVNTDICNPLFLLNFLRTKYFYDLANREAKGNAVKDLQLGVMKSFPMYLPPIEEQNRFENIYLKFIETKSSLYKSQHLSSNNFASLSQKAFSGEL